MMRLDISMDYDIPLPFYKVLVWIILDSGIWSGYLLL